jgi:hypothetical protein
MRSSPLIEMRFALATDQLRTAMEAAGEPDKQLLMTQQLQQGQQ